MTPDLTAPEGCVIQDAARFRWLLNQGIQWRGCYVDGWQEGEWLYSNAPDAIQRIDVAMGGSPEPEDYRCSECEEIIGLDGDGHNSRCRRFRLPPPDLEVARMNTNLSQNSSSLVVGPTLLKCTRCRKTSTVDPDKLACPQCGEDYSGRSETPRVDFDAFPKWHDEQGEWIQADFARTLERELAARDALISDLRSIFPAICEALGNGSFCTGDNSIEFLREIPKEAALVIKGKDALIEELRLDIRDRDHAIRHLVRGVDFERKMPNETRPIIREALRRADGKEGRDERQ